MKLQKYLYFVLWLLLQLLVKVNCQRWSHTSTFIDNRLYIFGGFNHIGKEFIYLDFSGQLNTQNLVWRDLTSIDTPKNLSAATSVKGGTNDNALLFLYGGLSSEAVAPVYIFDPQRNTWIIPFNFTEKYMWLTGIIDDTNRKMYLWGGLDVINKVDVNHMLILDTINLSWYRGSLVGAPDARDNYGAALLRGNRIIYMGGLYTFVTLNNSTKMFPASLKQVYIYDTTNDKWSTETTSGNVPSDRGGFSAVLGLDGQKIIIFGDYSNSTVNNPRDALYVLNLINFEWYVPKISGAIPNARWFHRADVIGKYMVISFGQGYDRSRENDILLLDISNDNEYMWTNDFISPLSPPPPSPENNKNIKFSIINKSNIVSAAIGLICGIIHKRILKVLDDVVKCINQHCHRAFFIY